VVFMIIVCCRLSMLTQCLTWFGKSPISIEEVHIIEDRERLQHTDEKRGLTQLSLLSHKLLPRAAVHKVAGLLPLAVTSLSLLFSSHFAL